MSGYSYREGMSNGAVEAYDSGLFPLSRLTVDGLRDAGWRETKTLAKALAKSGQWHRAVWHHTSNRYNQTDFYNPADLVAYWEGMTVEDRRQIKADLACKKAAIEAVRVRGSFAIWGGSRRRPRRVGEQAFEGTKIGAWIQLDGGGKKLADGRWIRWEAKK